jgi:AcrR family transcriptional regulator
MNTVFIFGAVMQRLKPEIEERLVNAALALFSQQGFRHATMAGIAQAAGVSTGNVYLYFENKEVLFARTIPATFVQQFTDLVCEKAQAGVGAHDLHRLQADAPYFLLSAQLLTFCVQHRRQIIIVLSKSEDTPYAHVADDMVRKLSQIAIAHLLALQPKSQVTTIMRFNLAQIYRNAIAAVVNILHHFESPLMIRRALQEYTRFHVSGLKGLLS